MINDIKNNSIVICSNSIKKDILINNNILKNIKFITINEFINNYYGTYKIDAIHYIMNKYNFNYDVTIEYLNNIFYDYEALKDLYYDLECNDLLIFNDRFKNDLNNKNIYVIGYYNLDKYVINTLNELNAIFINDEDNKYIHDIYEFDSIDDEIDYVARHIIDNHKNNLNDVYLVNVNSDYYNVLKRIFNMYHININLNEKNSIYSIKEVQDFIKYLKSNNKINVDIINNIDIKNKVIDLLNKYNINKIDKYYINIIENELKKIYLDNELIDNAVNIIDFEDIYLKDKYYYILSFNQGFVPKVFNDDKLIKDTYRKNINLNTSFDNYINYKNMIINKLNNYRNIIITYKLKDDYKEFIKSPLIDELNLNVIKEYKKEYKYSNRYNKLELSKMLDNYIKFNIEDINLKDLYKTYKDINYLTYDNTFKGINYSLLKEYKNKGINISYSSMDIFYKCQFRYYINNILCLDDFEDTFQTLIGKLFHYCLSKMYDDNFDLKNTYNDYLKDKVLSNKELFYLDKLYMDLESIINIIRMQDRHSKFDEVLTEKNIEFPYDDELNISIKGFIDKIKIFRENNNVYVSIIDYKTGSISSSLDNINDGLNMQLPMYIYLIKRGMNNANVVGFYLQKILNNKKIDSKDDQEDLRSSLKLIGYTIDNEELIEKFDDTYINSDVIKSMKITKNGFSSNAKLISEEEINKVSIIVEDNINNMIKSIKDGDFKINPKRIDNELIGCKYCKFKDLCFKKEEDILDLKNMMFNELLKDK